MRERTPSKTWLFVVLVVVSNTLGNFALSTGMKQSSGSLLISLLHPWVIAGIALLIFWTLARMHLLSLADLSFVLPVTAVGYVLNAMMAALFLGEKLSTARWSGTFLIMLGTALVGSTIPKAHR